MRLASIREAFDHADWIFELKYDGFRSLLHSCEMADVRSCPGTATCTNRFHRFVMHSGLNINAILDGEIVALDGHGCPVFYDLLRHRSKASFVAFDIMELGGRDLRRLPLIVNGNASFAARFRAVVLLWSPATSKERCETVPGTVSP